MTTYTLHKLDTHPTAVDLNNKTGTWKGDAPFRFRDVAEWRANQLNRTRPDNMVHVYVKADG